MKFNITIIQAVFVFFFVFATNISAQDIGNKISVFDRQCTSFVLDNNGYAVFGSNFDYGKDISEGLIFVNKRNVKKSYWQSDSINPHACWVSKYVSVSFNLCMQHFSWAGMNEAG
jgi:penicillin V acylase-like amidase (Ntn superfamily)